MRKSCVVDGTVFEAQRPHAKFCSDRCRKRHQRKPAEPEPPLSSVTSLPEVDGELTAATRRKLELVDRAGTELGAAAMLLARRADRVGLTETGSGLAALMREWDAMLTKAVAGAEQSDDVIARIQESAALKLIQGGRRGA
jgi:hypothetical protein